MKVFFKRILIFLGIIILFSAGFEIWARKVFQTETDLYLKFKSIDQVKDSIEILVIGHSHLEKGINPQYFSQKAFNLAYSAQDLYYDNKLIKHYMDDLPLLKTLIIGVDYLSFGYDESKTSMYYVRDYHKELKLKSRNGISYLYLLNHSIFWINRAKVLKYLFQGFPPKSEHSFSGKYEVPVAVDVDQILMASGYRATWTNMTEDELSKDASITVGRGVSLYNSNLEEESMTYLNEIIELAVEKNIEVYLVDAPVSDVYNMSFSKDIKSNYSSLLNKILNNYPEVEYINATTLFKSKHEVFYNSNHLNVKGSASFTLFLDSLISKNQASYPYNYAD